MIKSLNEPEGGSNDITTTPSSINEPPGVVPQEVGPTTSLPVITSIDPAGCAVGGEPFTMDVEGENFTPETAVTVSGVELNTVFVSPTELTASVNPSGAVVGEYPVCAKLGGYVSPATTLTVHDPAVHRGKPTTTLSNTRSKASKTK